MIGRILVGFLLLIVAQARAATVKGTIILNELGGRPIANVQIIDSAHTGGPWASGSDGGFTLDYPERIPGQRVKIVVNKEGYVVVNDVQLDLALPADPDANPLQIIICKEADREEMALRFYRLKITENDESYRRHVEERLQAKEEEVRRLTQNLNETKAEQQQEEIDREDLARRLYQLKSFEAIEATYQKRLKELEDTQQATPAALMKLQQERDQARSAAEKAAEELAKNQPGQNTEVYQQAKRLFLDGKIGEALKFLDEQDEKMRQSEAQVKKAIEDFVQALLLKAQLLAVHFRFDDAEQVYLKAIGAAPDSFQAHFAYAQFNQELNRYKKADTAYGWCLDWARTGGKNAELALTLNNLGILDRDQHRLEEARKAFEEALQIRRELAQKNPEAYLPDVATTLNNLGDLDLDQGRMEEARKAFEEALQINRELAQKNPETYLSGVATTLDSLGNLDSAQNRMEGRKEFEEALQIRRELAQKNPEAYLPDVAGTLNNLGVFDREQGRMEEARKEFAEALQIRRELAQKNPETYQPHVADTLNNLGILDRDQSRMEEARKEFAGALEIYESFAQKNPEQFAPDVTRTKSLLAELPK